MIRKIIFKILISQITQADDVEITEIIRAVIRRYTLVYPEWEVMFLSVPREANARREQLEEMLRLLEKQGTL